jgi:hypothetical protein
MQDVMAGEGIYPGDIEQNTNSIYPPQFSKLPCCSGVQTNPVLCPFASGCSIRTIEQTDLIIRG